MCEFCGLSGRCSVCGHDQAGGEVIVFASTDRVVSYQPGSGRLTVRLLAGATPENAGRRYPITPSNN